MRGSECPSFHVQCYNPRLKVNHWHVFQFVHKANKCLNNQPNDDRQKFQLIGFKICTNKRKKDNKDHYWSCCWTHGRIQTLSSTYCIIYPVDANTNSDWAESFSPRLQKIMRKRRCAIFSHRCDVSERSSLTWIGVNLLYILQSPPSFLRFLVYFHFSLPMSLPTAGCRLNRADGDWYPLTRSSLSPLSRWHRDTKCELSARQAD